MVRFPFLPKSPMPQPYQVTGAEELKASARQSGTPPPPQPEGVQRLEAELADNAKRRAAIAAELPEVAAEYERQALAWDTEQLQAAYVAMCAANDKRRALLAEDAQLADDAGLLKGRLDAAKRAYRLQEHEADLVDLETLLDAYTPGLERFKGLAVDLVDLARELQQRRAKIQVLYGRCRDYASHAGAPPPPDEAKRAGALLPMVREAWFTNPRGPDWARKELGLDD